MNNKRPKTFFITGTDTNVGKTFISAGILQAANVAGLSSAAIKPLAAGGVKTEEGFFNDDALILQQQCSLPMSYEQVNPVCLEEAVAPHIAATKLGRRVNASQLAGFCRGVIIKKADITVIEGAGGWKVPLNNKEFFSDVIKELNVPVIVVVAMRLGCINHALLTAQAMQADDVQIAGWIANQVEVDMPVYDENLKTLKEMLPMPLLAEIKYIHNFSAVSICVDQIDIETILNSA